MNTPKIIPLDIACLGCAGCIFCGACGITGAFLTLGTYFSMASAVSGPN